LIRVYSRGGIWFITAEACSDSTLSLSASDRPSIWASAAATILRDAEHQRPV